MSKPWVESQAQRLPIVAALIIATIAVCGVLYFGVEMGGDALRYGSRGGRLIAHWLDGVTPNRPYDFWTYLSPLPNILIGIGNRVFGDAFATISVILNITLFAFLARELFRFWFAISEKPPGVMFLPLAIYIMIGLPAEVVKYTYSALSSDILAMSIITFFLIAVGKGILAGNLKYWIIAGLLAGISLITRPTGVVTCVLLLVILFDSSLRRWIPGRSGVIARVALFVLLPLCITFVVWPSILSLNKAGNPWAVELTNIVPSRIVEFYDRGMVVAGLLRTYHAEPWSVLDFAKINLYRFFYYLVPLRSGYSVAHVMTNLAYVTLLWVLVVKGWRAMGYGCPMFLALRFNLLLSPFYFALFHAMTFVEDGRYQLPMWPGLWLLAGAGAVAMTGSALRLCRPGACSRAVTSSICRRSTNDWL